MFLETKLNTSGKVVDTCTREVSGQPCNVRLLALRLRPALLYCSLVMPSARKLLLQASEDLLASTFSSASSF